jgi:hypothetical protein
MFFITIPKMTAKIATTPAPTYIIANAGPPGSPNQQNKVVSINALKKYVYEEVEKLSGGLQKPTSRLENLEMDWKVW